MKAKKSWRETDLGRDCTSALQPQQISLIFARALLLSPDVSCRLSNTILLICTEYLRWVHSGDSINLYLGQFLIPVLCYHHFCTCLILLIDDKQLQRVTFKLSLYLNMEWVCWELRVYYINRIKTPVPHSGNYRGVVGEGGGEGAASGRGTLHVKGIIYEMSPKG